MQKILFVAVLALMLSGITCAAQTPAKADDILKQAEQTAADQNKPIFLIFGASWCEACHQMDAFFANSEVAQIFAKYFVIAKLTFGEAAAGHAALDNPGSDDLITKYGGIPAGGGVVGLPFIAVLDPGGKLIASSKTHGKAPVNAANGEFPTQPEEVRWFLGMVKKGAPAMTAEETHKLQDALRAATVVAPSASGSQ
ncbi:MAG: thioredoxin family protein [Candidatus Acidiferrum sp.]|jgi:thioredoxin-related protein